MKVEEGLCDGKVLYHSLVKKTAGEASEQQDEKEQARQLKEKRRKQQVHTCVIVYIVHQQVLHVMGLVTVHTLAMSCKLPAM